MKKLFILLLLTIFSFSLFAQERELSNYEKYRIEKEKESYITSTVNDTIHDTVYVEAETSEPVVVNNYYVSETEPNLRFNLTFGYGWGYYNQPYCRYYDPWYSYGYGYGYPYYGYGYNNYYGHNHYYGYYSRPRGQRYATSNALGWNRNYYQPYNKTYRSGYIGVPTATKKSQYNVYQKTTANTRPTANVNRRGEPVTRMSKNQQTMNSRTTGARNANTPRYNRPVTRSRAPYNNSKVTRNRTTTHSRAVQPQRSTQQRSNYTRPSSTKRSYSTPQRSQSRSYSPSRSTAPSRSYNAPSRAPSRSYSSPSRSSGSRSYTTPSRSSSSRSSGGRR